MLRNIFAGFGSDEQSHVVHRTPRTYAKSVQHKCYMSGNFNMSVILNQRYIFYASQHL